MFKKTLHPVVFFFFFGIVISAFKVEFRVKKHPVTKLERSNVFQWAFTGFL